MTDEDALHAAIADRPNDDTPRLVLADFLDDSGRPHEAAYHRGDVASRRASGFSEAANSYTMSDADPRSPGPNNIHHPHARAVRDIQYKVASANQTHVAGLPYATAESHRTIAGTHERLAGYYRMFNDARGEELHQRAADAHTEAANHLSAVGMGVKEGMTYYPRDKRKKPVLATGVRANNTALRTTGRVLLTVRNASEKGPPRYTPVHEFVATYHPAAGNSTAHE